MRLDREDKLDNSLGEAAVPSDRVRSSSALLSHDLAFALAAAFGFAVTLATFWPGYMSVDSLVQLGEARTHQYNDWHPPVMSWLWSLVDSVIPGPQGMLILHNATFWGGLALIARNSLRSAFGALAVLAIGFLPPMFGLLSTIWKDVAQGAMLLCGFALLQHARMHNSRWALWAALPPLAYGTLVRHNGFFAALPLTLWWGWLAMKLYASRWTRRWTVTGAALLVALVLLSIGVTRALTGGKSMHHQQVILLHDLVAISLERHQNLLPDYLQKSPHPLSLERLALMYDPGNTVWLWCCEGPRIPLTQDPTQNRQLLRQWFKVVSQNPGVYLRHRWKTVCSQFGIASAVVAYPFHHGIDPNSFGLSFRPGRWNTWVMAELETTKNSFLFRGWVYVVATVAFMVLSRLVRPRNFGMALVLGSSGLLYAVTLFPIDLASDFRLIWWTAVVGWVLPLIVFSNTQEATEPARASRVAVGGSRSSQWRSSQVNERPGRVDQ